MAAAFQIDAFQNNAFQIDVVAAALADPGISGSRERVAFRQHGRSASGHAREVSGFYGLESPRRAGKHWRGLRST